MSRLSESVNRVLSQQNDALAWRNAAYELALWTVERLVNRDDVYGRYLSLERRSADRSKSITAPAKGHRFDGALTVALLARHYGGADAGHLLGVHAISRTNRSRWFVIDVDQHDDIDGDGTAKRNLAAAQHWCDVLRRLQLNPLLLDSNGGGGYHLLQVLNESVAAHTVYNVANWLIRNFADYGLSQRPETFPKQPSINDQRRYGSWWRLPGKHHTRTHWTKIWQDGRWLSGHDAIQVLLGTHGDPPQLIPAEARQYVPPALAAGNTSASASAVNGPISPPRPTEHWRDVLAGRKPGGRHEALLQLAGHLLGKRVDPHIVEEVCALWNDARNQPPKPEEQVRRTVQDLIQRSLSRPVSRRGQHAGSQTIILRPGQ